MLCYRNVSHGVPLDIATIDASRAELINWGLMGTSGGMTMGQVATALQDRYQVKPVKFVGYQEPMDFNMFHNDLKVAMQNHQAVLYETAYASGLPGNQQQPVVDYHFILVWGWDSVQGYYCCNGDRIASFSGPLVQDPVWYSSADLEASKPCGYVILPAVTPAAPPPSGGNSVLTLERDPQGNVTGAHDETNKHIGGGFAYEAESKGWLDHSIEIPEEDIPGIPAFCVLKNTSSLDITMVYSQGVGVHAFGDVGLALVVAGLAQGQQKAAPPAPKVDVSQDLADLQRAINTAQGLANTDLPHTLADLKQKLGE